MKIKHVTRLFIGVIIILLVPLVAMQYSDEIDWQLLDFVVACILLMGFGIVTLSLFFYLKNYKYRWIILLLLFLLLLLVWAELAVGIFGSPFAGT